MPLDKIYSFKISEELRDKMQKFNSRINWSAWIRERIEAEIEELEKNLKTKTINFCPKCGTLLSSDADKFCQKCGAVIPHSLYK